MPKRRTVMFLGLGASHKGWPQFRNFSGEVWTLNDWYQFRGPYDACRKPQRIYNIHQQMLAEEQEIQERGRFQNWREAYESSGALIICQSDLGFSNQRMFDMDRAKAILPNQLSWSATLAYMFADAIAEGFHEIRLERFSLYTEGEYRRQGFGIMMCVDEARRRGLRVNWPYEAMVRRSMKVDWSTEMDVNLRYGTDRYQVVKITPSMVDLPAWL